MQKCNLLDSLYPDRVHSHVSLPLIVANFHIPLPLAELQARLKETNSLSIVNILREWQLTLLTHILQF